jgi:integrase
LENIFVMAKGGNYAAMPFDQVPAFMQRLSVHESTSAKALEFLILTAARTGEVRYVTWTEIDLDRRLWTIPASRMKAGREHTIPLSKRAVALLKALSRIGDYVFPGANEGKPLSDMALMQLLRGMDANGYKVHGFRSAFRDWAGDLGNFDREVIEHALAHGLPDKVEAAYRRGTALKKRELLMQAWAQFCDANTTQIKGNVTQLRAK